MKRSILLFIILFSVQFTKAQMDDGTYVPNFTGIDINGDSYTLYDYLDSGYAVIIDVSTTWCGPCWSYHTSHKLEDIWANYGPNGSKEIMILFVEGDEETTLADLQGTGGSTQGDWISGTPYPIIDDHTIAELLQVGYFPTLYMICPNRIVNEFEQYDDITTIYNLSQDCPVANTNNDIRLESILEPRNIIYCENTSITPQIKIQNIGINTLQSATITTYIDDIQQSSIQWNGNINTYNEELIYLPIIQGLSNGQHTIKIDITNPNGLTDEDSSNNILTQSFITDSDGLIGTLTINTDNYPSETSCEIKDETGATLLFIDDLEDANSTYNYNLCLLEDNCYELWVYDQYADGLSSGSVEFIVDGNVLTSVQGDDFTSAIKKDFCVPTTNLNNKLLEKSISIYPNPSKGIYNIKNCKNCNIKVYNSLGQLIKEVEHSESEDVIDISNFKKGQYICVIKSVKSINYYKLIKL